VIGPTARLVALAVTGTALAAPAGALANTTASYSPSSGLLVQGDSEGNDVGVIPEGAPQVSKLVVQAGARGRIVSGNGCIQVDNGRVECTVTGSVLITANAGGGDDSLSMGGVSGGEAAPDSFLSGGDGNDIVRGKGGFDAIDGGPGNDVLSGGSGNDMVTGGDGDDLLLGDSSTFAVSTPVGGSDTFLGGAGKDTFQAAAAVFHADRFDGGPGGRDIADYSRRTQGGRLSVVFGEPGAANDGVAGEGDRLEGVEELIGGHGNDVLFADVSATTVSHTQKLSGNDGDDELRVGLLSGSLDGGLGSDSFTTFSSAVIEARDGVHDTFNCSSPATELVTADLRDGPFVKCAPVRQGAVKEGPNVVFRSRRVTVEQDGSLSARLACPRTLKRACAGRLVARLDKTGRRFGRATRYSIRPGRSKTIRTGVPSGQRKAARRRQARVLLRSIERGDHGRKTTITSLPARRG
jgi:hypothetical protein